MSWSDYDDVCDKLSHDKGACVNSFKFVNGTESAILFSASAVSISLAFEWFCFNAFEQSGYAMHTCIGAARTEAKAAETQSSAVKTFLSAMYRKTDVTDNDLMVVTTGLSAQESKNSALSQACDALGIHN